MTNTEILGLYNTKDLKNAYLRIGRYNTRHPEIYSQPPAGFLRNQVIFNVNHNSCQPSIYTFHKVNPCQHWIITVVFAGHS